MTSGKHGCCADKACTDRTCMELPQGKTCLDCVHTYRCCTIFGHKPTDTYCDWFPRKFRERPRDVIATEVTPSDEPGAWTCKACGFRGFWHGGLHCIAGEGS